MIGAGSIGFTRRLMQDVLGVPELQDTHFALTDISKPNLDMVHQLCARDISENKLPAQISATTDRRAAIADADFVICMIRQGGLEAFQDDIDIPPALRNRSMRGRHVVRRRHHVRPADHSGVAGILPGHSRTRPSQRPLSQLLQSHGHEHLGLQPVRWRQDHRPLPRRAGRALANHHLHRAMGQAGRPSCSG